MYEDGTSHELASLHPVVKRNPALAMSSSERLLVQESPTLGLEELLTAAHVIMHGLTELLTPITHGMAASAHGPERRASELLTPITHGMAASAHGPERMAGEIANTTKTPDTSSAVKSAMLRIANGLCADCAQDKRARRESAKRNLVREQR
jgi:hypothetical protein